ncbi:DUF983 domain-containing protein [Peteryoungia ipomoeae]|uniref:DUF983 domain-containing protein n=1 Tax=Peteryoungia ipomoeae TaxID=1210932 RepID=A0A4S8P5Q6_9HYPH|nr:DUF983 domain-containing protein [Peteryoungia ipomoeae]THV25543.1 DUF983 domain-containing protein [Peteryoungia ipomoeae]
MTIHSSSRPGEIAADQTERLLGHSIKRGLVCRCPACGEGKLFRAYLKVADRCEACGEDLHHHRADDLPAYLVILILGHVLVGGYMMTDMAFPLPAWVHFAIWAPIGVVASLLCLQPIKGGVVGLQWALRMHGFGGGSDDPEVV